MRLTHIDLFAGVGGFALGFQRAGIQTVAHVEKDEKCQQVLRRHFPDHLLLADVCEAGAHNLPYADIITFGSPCQDLSVAGKRKGLEGERSGLFFEAARIIREIGPRYAVWENVPGALSSNNGRDFQSVLAELLGASVPMPRSGRWATAGMVRTGQKEIAWRVLDAQYFGVAQRRRRIFLVFCPSGASASSVLFEREGLPGDTPPRREAGKGFAPVAGTLAASGGGMERPAGNCNELDFCIPIVGTLDGKCCAANRGSQSNEAEFIVPAAIPYRMTAFGEYADDDSGSTVKARDYKGATDLVAYIANWQLVGVRRLTPVECEKLQGFPPGWTAFTADGKPQSDSARYRQMGNAVCVAVAEWIGRRIVEAEKQHERPSC